MEYRYTTLLEIFCSMFDSLRLMDQLVCPVALSII